MSATASGRHPARLARVPLGLDPTPAQALLALREDPRPFALVGRWAGGGCLVGSDPVRLAHGGAAALAALGEAPDATAPAGAEGAVGGGWVGHLGFGLGRELERLPPDPPRPVPGPDAQLAYYDHVLRRDAHGDWWFEALRTDTRAAALDARLDELRRRLAAPLAPGPARLRHVAPAAPGYAGHRAAVAAGVEAIAAGEIFQANLCLRVEARLEGEAIDLFARTVEALAPAYGAFLGDGDRALVSLSPELFLRREGRAVRTAPIKGTAPRDADPAALAASGKDRAEHVMILDLMRNDLGRVCRTGSVRAELVPRVEGHPGVWHLVSDVRGELRAEVTDAGLVRASFPPGSVTGAPKVQALKVIARLEATGREAYTGAIGYFSPLAGLELNVAIRTFEVAGGHVWLGAGGGVVADSDPDAETREAWAKAAPLVAAAGARLAPPDDAPAAGPAARPTRRERPDPALGVLETIGVRDGVPVRLDAHLARLAASVRTLYGTGLPAGLAGRAAAAAAGGGRARLRVRFRPDAGCELELSDAGIPPDAPVALAPLLVPGGLGAHKWLDRRILEGHAAAPLLVDLDGAVLEAAWATVWAVEDGGLSTPPADGRLLPGVTRAAVLATPGLDAQEARLDLDRLRRADAIVLTSAVSLATEATLTGGAGTAAGHAAVARLRERL